MALNFTQEQSLCKGVPLVKCKKRERGMILTLPDWLLEVHVPHALLVRGEGKSNLGYLQEAGPLSFVGSTGGVREILIFESIWEFLVSIIEEVHLHHPTRFHPRDFVINNPGCVKRCTEYDFLPKAVFPIYRW